MAGFRSYDAFAKPVDGTRTTTSTGGLITVLASAAASILFLSQLILYCVGDVRHSLHLAESSSTSILRSAIPAVASHKVSAKNGHHHHHPVHAHMERHRYNLIPLSVHVTFPHVRCSDLDYAHDGASLSNGQFERLYGRGAFQLRPASPSDLGRIFGGNRDRSNPGCTLRGTINVPKVGGSLSVTISARAWSSATSFFQLDDIMLGGGGDPNGRNRPRLHNCTHHIHSIAFGEPFPRSHDPLRGATHVIDNESGVALNNVAVRLVPTLFKRPFRSALATYQASVTSHIVQPHTLAAQRSAMLPGMQLTYDFTPLAVHHVESRENVLVFLASLVSIVGGVFVTVGLVTGCLVGGVSAAVSKKTD